MRLAGWTKALVLRSDPPATTGNHEHANTVVVRKIRRDDISNAIDETLLVHTLFVCIRPQRDAVITLEAMGSGFGGWGGGGCQIGRAHV